MARNDYGSDGIRISRAMPQRRRERETENADEAQTTAIAAYLDRLEAEPPVSTLAKDECLFSGDKRCSSGCGSDCVMDMLRWAEESAEEMRYDIQMRALRRFHQGEWSSEHLEREWERARVVSREYLAKNYDQARRKYQQKLWGVI